MGQLLTWVSVAVQPTHDCRRMHHAQMLGAFSFGDYFKAEAIRMAWELSTRALGIPGAPHLGVRLRGR